MKDTKKRKFFGKVYLVGAGPGAADLITVRAQGVLKEADVIIYDYLVDKRVLEVAKQDAELINCDELGRKRYSGRSSVSQRRINSLLVRKAREGRKVARLKNGDPFVFGRSSSEIETLIKEKIEFEIIPGVTAANAAACLSGIPLTDRRFASSCVFVTGHEDQMKKKSLIDWDSLAKSDTVVFYMAARALDGIVEKMLTAGRDRNTPVAVVQDVSLPTQKILCGTLNDIAAKAGKHRIKPPAVVVMGKVAELQKRFNWMRRSRHILFTGLSGKRFFLKGTYSHVPLIDIRPMEDYKEVDGYLRNIADFDWIVFASRYGVEYFFKRMKAVGYDSRKLAKVKIAVIGNSTKKKLMDYGMLADLVPVRESSSGLVEEFRKAGLREKKIFLLRSDLSDKSLKKELEKLGAVVTTAVVYRNVMPENLPDLDLDEFDEIMFTSPSTVRNFKKRYKKVPENVKIRCIGEVTLREARKCRLSD